MMHRRLEPALISNGPPLEQGRDHVVAVFENIREDIQPLTDNALHRMPAAFDARIKVLDDGDWRVRGNNG